MKKNTNNLSNLFKYYKKYMKKMHMICKMEEKRVKYMCFGTNDVL